MTSATVLNTVVVFVAVIATIGLLRFSRTIWPANEHTREQVRLFGTYSPLLTWLKYRRLPPVKPLADLRSRVLANVPPYLEVVAIGLVAAWFGRDLLNLDPNAWPWGGEFTFGTQSHYVWTLLARCGPCVMWNGFSSGGSPAFVELHGAPLHPLVVVTTLLWGVVNGSKITVVASVAMAGLAQWWLARIMRLGLAARLWAGVMGVVAGHVAGRMQVGLVTLALSMAASTLLLAACVDLALNRTRRSAVRLGVILALAILAGQGYMQIGMAFSVLPALSLLLLQRNWKLPPVWKEFALAGGLAVLMVGVMLVPLLHFWPSMDKDTDPGYSSAQPLAYLPFNLVISDLDFYNNESLGKQAFAYLYTNYVGWIPVLLALLAVYLAPRSQRRLLGFFLAAIFLAYFAASAVPLRWAEWIAPNVFAGLRNPALIACLAVPLILALAGWAVDLLIHREWPKLDLALADRPATGLSLSVSTLWLVLPLLLLGAVRSAYVVNRGWLTTAEPGPGTQLVVNAMSALVPPAKAEWIQPPWGEHYWLPATMDAGHKIAHFLRPWRWRDADFPLPYVDAVRDEAVVNDPAYHATVDGIPLLVHPENEYAFVDTGHALVPCVAQALGGNIDVTCVTTEPGRLIVREHWWSGWGGALDGQRLTLTPGAWLSADLPAGTHSISFRYRPWDVAVGFLLTLLGLGLAVYWWRRPAVAAGPLPPPAPEPVAGPDPLPAA